MKNKALLLLLQENKADLKLKKKRNGGYMANLPWMCLKQEVIVQHLIAPPQLDSFWTPKMEELWIRPVGD